MFNFELINDPEFEAFIRIYNLSPFVPIPRTCEVLKKGRTSLYKLHKERKLTIRDLAGTSGVFASEIYTLLKSATPIEGQRGPRIE